MILYWAIGFILHSFSSPFWGRWEGAPTKKATELSCEFDGPCLNREGKKVYFLLSTALCSIASPRL